MKENVYSHKTRTEWIRDFKKSSVNLSVFKELSDFIDEDKTDEQILEFFEHYDFLWDDLIEMSKGFQSSLIGMSNVIGGIKKSHTAIKDYNKIFRHESHLKGVPKDLRVELLKHGILMKSGLEAYSKDYLIDVFKISSDDIATLESLGFSFINDKDFSIENMLFDDLGVHYYCTCLYNVVHRTFRDKTVYLSDVLELSDKELRKLKWFSKSIIRKLNFVLDVVKGNEVFEVII